MHLLQKKKKNNKTLFLLKRCLGFNRQNNNKSFNIYPSKWELRYMPAVNVFNKGYTPILDI